MISATRVHILLFASLVLGLAGSRSEAQSDDLHIFGFFQNSLVHQTGFETEFEQESERNSFSVQQHNLFFQHDIDENWRAFLNYEFLNSFSTRRRWGSANLEEVWLRYRHSERASLKLGLQIPIFNNLNEIKNRTPLLPYIIRPLVYETSFSDVIAVEEYLPARAFVQTYGFLPLADAKLDYALFVGNGPNLNDDSDAGQTGVDTTDSFLIGGRLGVRVADLKAGLSMTRDHLNAGGSLEYGGRIVSLEQVTRRRLGADLSYLWRDLSFEAEGIWVTYDDDLPGVSFDRRFYYATLGYRASEQLFVYASYWVTDEDDIELVDISDVTEVAAVESTVKVPTVGVSYQLRDSITLKAQFAPVDIEGVIPSQGLRQDIEFNHLSAAVSVFF